MLGNVQVFRGGDFAIESSEDEKEEGPQVDPLDAGDPLVDGRAALFEASAQFCRALDREDEFDANDCIADAIDLKEERPERNTQVLTSVILRVLVEPSTSALHHPHRCYWGDVVD